MLRAQEAKHAEADKYESMETDNHESINANETLRKDLKADDGQKD